MTKTRITATAPWTYSQVLSGVIPILIVIASWVLWFTQSSTLPAAIVSTVIFGFMGAFFTISNHRLKKNSTLIAELANDEESNISVWQVQPRPYWTGRLDMGRNKVALTQIRKIAFGNVQGVQLMSFIYVNEKGEDMNFTLPIRLFKQDAVRLYIADAIKKAGGNVKFENDDDAKRFALLLAEAQDM